MPKLKNPFRSSLKQEVERILTKSGYFIFHSTLPFPIIAIKENKIKLIQLKNELTKPDEIKVVKITTEDYMNLFPFLTDKVVKFIDICFPQYVAFPMKNEFSDEVIVAFLQI